MSNLIKINRRKDHVQFQVKAVKYLEVSSTLDMHTGSSFSNSKLYHRRVDYHLRTKYGDPCDEWQRHTDNEWAVDHFDHNYCRRPHLKGQNSSLHGRGDICQS